MKISKSKQELARIISENGGWRDGAESSAQCTGGEISFWSDTATKRPGEDWRGSYLGACADIELTGVKLQNWHQTILSRDEYFHLYQAPDAKTEFCESVMRSIPEPSDNPTIEQLAADYRNAKDYAERKQQEADDAKADADAKLKALELAGEAIGLIVSPITAKQDPELVITDWSDLQVGDEIKVIGFDGDIAEEQRCDDLLDTDSCTVVKQGDYVEIEITGKHNGKRSGWLLDGNVKTKWRFIRRP